MKKYSIINYVRYKEDIQRKINKLPDVVDSDYTIYDRDQMITCFLPLVENLARKFSTSQQASGVMTIMDLIQEGNAGLIHAVGKLDYSMLKESEDQEKTLKSFLSKRIRGAIRRGIDINRGDIRIPEHKLNEIRRSDGRDKKMIQMFFNSVFLSMDDENDKRTTNDFEDKSILYNINILNKYILSLMKQHLNDKEYDVLRMSFGLDCDKIPAKKIAELLEIKGVADFVRVSQIKREAIDKLIDNIDPDQIIDFLN